ncbi:Peptidase S8, subtilisin-related like protein [Aduncisulcus paluster]|uniref:Peptidase S8, subtilisin-related like protein n=1 Tax=Aduncisulcus paluster TaxID=2918883 RepID=A0ABQ5JVM8_9EUKA|nr:Peptidase S8, subtilisin-related like protein [Aduncisulcus paluster]
MGKHCLISLDESLISILDELQISYWDAMIGISGYYYVECADIPFIDSILSSDIISSFSLKFSSSLKFSLSEKMNYESNSSTKVFYDDIDGFSTERIPTSLSPLSDQWHLDETDCQSIHINVTPMWDGGITGKDVVVVITDQGFDIDHPSLENRWISDWFLSSNYRLFPDFTDTEPLPSSYLETHATECAGIIASSSQSTIETNDSSTSSSSTISTSSTPYNIQIRSAQTLSDDFARLHLLDDDLPSCGYGIAPEVSLAGRNFLSTLPLLTSTQYVSVYLHASVGQCEHVNVFSHSWGSFPDFTDTEPLPSSYLETHATECAGIIASSSQSTIETNDSSTSSSSTISTSSTPYNIQIRSAQTLSDDFARLHLLDDDLPSCGYGIAPEVSLAGRNFLSTLPLLTSTQYVSVPDFTDTEPLPSSYLETHATECAGIIASSSQSTIETNDSSTSSSSTISTSSTPYNIQIRSAQTLSDDFARLHLLDDDLPSCGYGIAPEVSLAGRNFLSTLPLLTSTQYVSVYLHASVGQCEHVNVFSHSWGSLFVQDQMYPRSSLTSLSSILSSSCPHTFFFIASGNDKQIGGDSNLQSERGAYIYKIGGVGPSGRMTNYSNGGSDLLISAPTMGYTYTTLDDCSSILGIFTSITRPSLDGSAQCTSNFSGTSASTPMVSGVAAALIQMMSDWEDEEDGNWGRSDIIMWLITGAIGWGKRPFTQTLISDDSNDTSTQTIATSFSHLYISAASPLLSEQWSLTGAGLFHSTNYGFGILNAGYSYNIGKSLLDSSNFSSFSSSISSYSIDIPLSTGQYIETPGQCFLFDIGSGASHKYNGDSYQSGVADMYIEHISVGITIGTSSISINDGNIQIVLVSPSNVTSILLPYRSDNSQNQLSSKSHMFSTIRHYGEHLSGRWRVCIETDSSSSSLSSFALVDEIHFEAKGRPLLNSNRFITPSLGSTFSINSSIGVVMSIEDVFCSDVSLAVTSSSEISVYIVPNHVANHKYFNNPQQDPSSILVHNHVDLSSLRIEYPSSQCLSWLDTDSDARWMLSDTGNEGSLFPNIICFPIPSVPNFKEQWGDEEIDSDEESQYFGSIFRVAVIFHDNNTISHSDPLVSIPSNADSYEGIVSSLDIPNLLEPTVNSIFGCSSISTPCH